MDPLLWPKEVASLLNISVRTVYKNFRKLGGFYPAGMRVLRFRPDVIYGIMEGKGRMEVQTPIQEEEIHLSRRKFHSISSIFTSTNPEKHKLFVYCKPLSINRKSLR